MVQGHNGSGFDESGLDESGFDESGFDGFGEGIVQDVDSGLIQKGCWI